MSFDALRNIIAQRMRATDQQSGELRIARIFDAWRDILTKLWGVERAVLVEPVSFKEGVLKISTASPAAKQQLTVEQVRLMNELNRRLGGKVVQKLMIVSNGF